MYPKAFFSKMQSQFTFDTDLNQYKLGNIQSTETVHGIVFPVYLPNFRQMHFPKSNCILVKACKSLTHRAIILYLPKGTQQVGNFNLTNSSKTCKKILPPLNCF